MDYSRKRNLPRSESSHHNERLKGIEIDAARIQPLDESNEQNDEINEPDDFGFPAAERVMGESKSIGHKSKKVKKYRSAEPSLVYFEKIT